MVIQSLLAMKKLSCMRWEMVQINIYFSVIRCPFWNLMPLFCAQELLLFYFKKVFGFSS